MIERPLMSSDELKSMPKGSFVVMKTGRHPMRTKLKLFYKWGIQFEKQLEMPNRGSREVHYAGKTDLELAILNIYPFLQPEVPPPLPPEQDTGVKQMPTSTSLNTE